MGLEGGPLGQSYSSALREVSALPHEPLGTARGSGTEGKDEGQLKKS